MKNSSGNILFIVLIAVALFAALSYAVTQSSRGGGEGTAKETSTINAAVLSQYTASLRASLQRMTTDNHDLLSLEFNAPDDFSNLTSSSVGVFHPSGGGVIYEMGPSALIDNLGGNPTGQWIMTLNFEVKGIGTDATGSLNGNDLTAFMVGVKKEVCEQLNKRLGINTMPTENATTYSIDMITNQQTYYMDHDYILPSAESVIGAGAGDSVLAGKAEGCYYESAAKSYVYYSVLSER